MSNEGLPDASYQVSVHLAEAYLSVIQFIAVAIAYVVLIR
jgi:hypothetical protein